MPIKFTTTNQAATVHGVKVLVYGDSGVGKTVLCGTAPNPFLISAESGVLSLRRMQMPMATVVTIEDLEEVGDWCYRSREAQQFQTICLDSISEIAETVLGRAKITNKDPRQAYGELITQMERIIRYFRDLPGKHVYFSAKMEPMKDELTGIVRYMPSMPGSKLGPKLPFFFDEVLRLAIGKSATGETYRFLQTQPDLQNSAKDRSGSLAAVEPPNLTHIFNKIINAV